MVVNDGDLPWVQSGKSHLQQIPVSPVGRFFSKKKTSQAELQRFQAIHCNVQHLMCMTTPPA